MEFQSRHSDSIQILYYHLYFPLLKTHYGGRSRLKVIGAYLMNITLMPSDRQSSSTHPKLPRPCVHVYSHMYVETFTALVGFRKDADLHSMQKKTSNV